MQHVDFSSGTRLTEQAVRAMLYARRLRERKLGSDLFADPAWDMLLEALAAELGQQRLSISALCAAAAVPSTTALRWITKLERDGWLDRTEDTLDARRIWIALSTAGSVRLHDYFAKVSRSVITI